MIITFTGVYDTQNHLTTETRRIPNLNHGTTALIINRTYRVDGSLASITDAAGRTITYNYNIGDYLDSVTYNTTTLATYTYDFGHNANKPTDLVYSNGTHTTYAYDIFNRLQTLEVTSATGTLFSRQDYTYDSAGNRTSLTEDNDRTINYTYDNLDQLTGVDYSNIPPAVAGQAGTNDVQYTYDVWGNRTNLVNPMETVDYTYAANSNELTSLSHNNGALTANMVYDGNGNLTSEQYTRLGVNTRRTDYGFDAEGRLVGITYTNQTDTPTTNVLNFAYSDDGNRVGKSVNGVWTYTLNDGLNLLDDISANGTIQKTYIRGLDAIAEITASGTIQFVHTDALGSTILLTDNSGNIAARYEYDAFGNIVGASTQGADTNSLYTGQEFDPESELVYMNARYYNPALGRFISRDGVLGRDGDLLSRNGYIYVKNNPLKYIDPSGEIEAVAKMLALNAEITGMTNSTQFMCLNGQDCNDYFSRSLDQMIGGNYSDDVTLLGTAGQIAKGIFDIDLPGDIRDLYYDFTHWQWTWGSAGQTTIDTIGLIPVIGAVKYSDEAAALVKNTFRAEDVANKIAHGHAWLKHAHEFPYIKSEVEFEQMIKKVIENPSASKKLNKGREAFWDNGTRTIVIVDPNKSDFGSAFKPDDGKAYFDDLK